MSREGIAIKSSIVGVICQVMTLLIKFVLRTFCLRYLGIEIMGLDAVLIDVISMLSLAEMGITTAMLYRLYGPIARNEHDSIRHWMNAYKIVFRGIASVVAGIGIVVSFFLPYIISDISVEWEYVYLAFFLQLVGCVSSYLLAHNRLLITADQKNYFVILVDTIVLFVFSIAKVSAIWLMQSYVAYLILNIAQTALANIYLYLYARKHYPYLFKDSYWDNADLRILFGDAKNVLGNKIAGYIYGSTSNLIVSGFLGTVTVGLLSNYTFITKALKTLVSSAMSSMQPLLGNYLNASEDRTESFKVLRRYSFIRFIFAGITVVPFVTIASGFVEIWAGGSQYILTETVVLLLAADYYLGNMIGPLMEYATALGMFAYSKRIMIIAAITNLAVALLGVHIIGLTGVLWATVISQIVIFLGNYHIVMNKYFDRNRQWSWGYALQQVLSLLTVVISLSISVVISKYYIAENSFLTVIMKALISAIVFCVIILVLWRKSEELKYVFNLSRTVLRKIRHSAG